jgi:hypothetical protein
MLNRQLLSFPNILIIAGMGVLAHFLLTPVYKLIDGKASTPAG